MPTSTEQVTIISTTQYRGPKFPTEIPPQVRKMAEEQGDWFIYRFESKNGGVAWVPVNAELIADGENAEEAVRNLALKSLADLVSA